MLWFQYTAPPELTFPLFSDKKDYQITAMRGTEAYIIWYIINNRPPSSGKFLDQNLGPSTTTRFFHTLIKILAAAKKRSLDLH
ncbi:MAG TPA: hypothetical protein VM581_00730 [Magnetospirillaceae bacterium]|nr:hypothetical protein [Magnetospirillaceae bacterium]